MKEIEQLNTELYKQIKDNKAKCDWTIPIKSENGDDNMLIKKGGDSFPAYDMKNPTEEADRVASSLPCYKQHVTILIGIGLGHLANAIIKKSEKAHRIVIVESSLYLIKRTLENYDFSKKIRDKEFIIVTSSDQASLILQIIACQFIIEEWRMTSELYTTFREEYAEMNNVTGETLNQILCNTGTIAGAAGGIIADNDISCLPYVIRHRGVGELKGLFKDKPAILVSTGPSLARNIHHLKEVQDKVVIIAVGQALRPLLAYDIKPDFICTVDFGEVNIGHFKGLMDSDVPLVTINRTYAPLLKEWKGPKFIAATPVPGFEHMATGILTDKGFIDAGGSVAHMCFGLATLLGCNPIIFTGQDLALGETSHIPLVDAMGKVGVTEDGQILWKVQDQRCSLKKVGILFLPMI